MAHKEKQHYVPKFFLRRFSYQNDGKTIGIYNTRTGKLVPQAPLRSQAYRPYFYGKDGKIEDMLSQLEGEAATLLRRISTEGFLPTHDSEEWVNLLLFVVLSYLRNPTTTDGNTQQFRDLIAALFPPGEKLPRELKDFEQNNDRAVELSLFNVGIGLAGYYDLAITILRNETSQPFITSDHPVLLYNQYLEQRNKPGGLTGFAAIGLQTFLPIDARTAVMLYDPWTYKIGTRKGSCITIKDEKDIEQLNILNFLNCSEIIFFNHEATHTYICALCEKAQKFRKANIPSVELFYKTREDDEDDEFAPNIPGEHTDTLVMAYSTSLRTKLSLSFVTQTKQAKKHKLGNSMGHFRPGYKRIDEGKQYPTKLDLHYDDE